MVITTDYLPESACCTLVNYYPTDERKRKVGGQWWLTVISLLNIGMSQPGKFPMVAVRVDRRPAAFGIVDEVAPCLSVSYIVLAPCQLFFFRILGFSRGRRCLFRHVVRVRGLGAHPGMISSEFPRMLVYRVDQRQVFPRDPSVWNLGFLDKRALVSSSQVYHGKHWSDFCLRVP